MTVKSRSRAGYGQYCPLALATETLGGRWTILVLSRVIEGCATFSDIYRGVPRISPSLLSSRLSELEQAELVKREKVKGAKNARYRPTKAALELEPLLNGLAEWGQRWARDMEDDDLDPGFLAWSMHLRMNTDAMPAERTVLQFEFSGVPTEYRRFWLVGEGGAIDMCLKPPGFDVDLVVSSDIRIFVEAWRGIRDLHAEIRAGRIKLAGPATLKKRFPEWLMLSQFAPIKRKRKGEESKRRPTMRASG
ncbi:winged helix-turn-helix transcriptional regulator [Hyphococcus luteus]|uniref:Transcriptional regulator n=1 Tax=Hyphococcus luteus TaxID=2058213 RepID=A0A2S7K1B7_9PROT|nr:winged helix-turn-helix transcriptional regulator [Marinicaulis flavus]PQA86307.1 transcriptional regulator [Marinicaulis flavus]